MRTAKVNFNDYIGSDFAMGGISQAYVRYCVEGPGSDDPAAVDSYPEAVELHFFNCPGGEVYEGYAIYSYLRQVADAGTKVTAYIHGLCASIASLIVLAADERIVGPLGSTMIHKPLVDAGPYANADAHRKAAADLDQMEGQIAGVYALRTRIPAAELPELMRAETTFTADDAVANGFATALLAAPSAGSPAPKKAKILNYATPKPLTPPAAMASLNDTEKKSLFGEFKNWLKGDAPAVAAPVAVAAAPLADSTDDAADDMVGAEVPLADGTSIFVDTTDSSGVADVDEGTPVFADEALTTPVADGDYTLEDSRDFTVAGGVVTVISASADAAVPAGPAPAAPTPTAPREMSAQAKLKVATARAERAEAKLRAHVPSAGNPNRPGAQAFTEPATRAPHPLDEAAKRVNDKLQRGI